MAQNKSKNRYQPTKTPGVYLDTLTGRYTARFYIGGKKKWEALGTDRKSVADERYATRKAEIVKMRHALQEVDNGTATCEQLLEVVLGRIRDNAELKPKTKVCYEQVAEALKKTWPELEKLAPEDVTKDNTLTWRNRVRRDGTGFIPPGARATRSNGTSTSLVNKMIDMLQRVLDVAVERGQVARNRLRDDGGVKLKSSARKPVLPDNATLLAVFDEIHRGSNSRGLELADFCRFMAFQAARVSEARAVRWCDISFEKNLIHLRGTKTEASDRTVPMIPDCVTLLKKIWARRRAGAETAFNGEPVIDRESPVFRYGDASRSLARACAKLGVNRLTHHDLRDAFPTVALAVGISPVIIAAIMGHSDMGKLMAETYAHSRAGDMQEAASKISFGG